MGMDAYGRLRIDVKRSINGPRSGVISIKYSESLWIKIT